MRSKTKRWDRKLFSVDREGFYGEYGGRYAPEILLPALEELERAFNDAKKDPGFKRELKELYNNFVGRPTPLTYCARLTKELGGAKIYIKNEGSCLTGAHKINHCVGQVLLARRMGKRRIIADTGAGQHGLATSTVSAKFGFECEIYMGAIDAQRQRPNVFWMEQLGARVNEVHFGGKRLKDAVNAALKDWMANVETTHFLLGSCVGPHPFPELNRYFQRIVSEEIRSQLFDAEGKLPSYVFACVGGGSNAIGAFDNFLTDASVALIGVEAGGKGGRKIGDHASRFRGGRIGVAEGYKSLWLQTPEGQIADTHSISAGLDYAGIGPFHAYLKKIGRVRYAVSTDKEALRAVQMMAKNEGIFPALESAHAVAAAIKVAPTLPKKEIIVINVSGRAEKDIFLLAKNIGDDRFMEFLRNFS